MEDKAKCGHPLYWFNCYSGGFSLWSEDAYSHPAKMSPALCYRILQHLQELGLIKEGDTILDPMAGIGTTNVCAGAMGFKSISVELEEKFVNLQQQNKEYAERKLYKRLDWQMLKGDSRRLSDLLKGQGLKSVVSPPYESSLNNTAEQKGWDKLANDPTSSRYGRKSIPSVGAEYSDNPDNIGNLKDTPLKSIVSPPYQDSQGHPSLGSVNKDDWGKEGKDIVKRRGLSGEYGESEGQVGNLKSITSPPYEESLPNGLDRKAAEQMVQAMYDKHGRTYSKEDFDYQVELILKRSNREYGDTEGQIGKLKDKPLKSIVSPPYSEAQSGGGIAKKGYTGSKHTPTDLVGNRSYMPEVHGQSEGQIANLKDTPLKAITSPPYGDAMKTEKSGIDWSKDKSGRDKSKEPAYNAESNMPTSTLRYSADSDNIGNLKDTPLKAITSPPYSQSLEGTSRHQHRDAQLEQLGGIDFKSKDNIASLKDKPLKSITSPPYGDAEKRDRSKEASNESEKDYLRGDHNISAGYQGSDENIGVLADKPLKSIVSPPYEDALSSGSRHGDSGIGRRELALKKLGTYESFIHGQIGNEKQESYLSAMKKVYSEIALVSDVLCVVVKCPTRGGKLRRLDLDTITILEASGWRIHCQHRALLFEELEQADMFEGSKKQVKGRLSFFKRLSWQNGNPVASWEDIIICTRK